MATCAAVDDHHAQQSGRLNNTLPGFDFFFRFSLADGDGCRVAV
jgi:hypothetical protein